MVTGLEAIKAISDLQTQGIQQQVAISDMMQNQQQMRQQATISDLAQKFIQNPEDQQSLSAIAAINPQIANSLSDVHKQYLTTQAQKTLSVKNTWDQIPLSRRASFYTELKKTHAKDMEDYPLEYNEKTAKFIDDQFNFDSSQAKTILGIDPLDQQYKEAKIKSELAQTEKFKAETYKAYKEDNQPKAPAGYRYTTNGELEAIPGGPAAKQSAESAGKTALIRQGVKDIERFKDLISNKDKEGNITGYKRAKLAGLNTYGAPGARTEFSTLFNAVNARLRLESGAAVPETEVKRAMKTFAPSSLDSDETIKSKLERMGEFFNLAEEEIGRGRGGKEAISNSNNNDPAGIR